MRQLKTLPPCLSITVPAYAPTAGLVTRGCMYHSTGAAATTAPGSATCKKPHAKSNRLLLHKTPCVTFCKNPTLLWIAAAECSTTNPLIPSANSPLLFGLHARHSQRSSCPSSTHEDMHAVTGHAKRPTCCLRRVSPQQQDKMLV